MEGKKGGGGCICPASALVKALLTHVVLGRDDAVVMDMEAGLEHLGRATTESMDALVIGTPIYYDQVSARAKIFFDRLHFYSKTHGEEYRRRFPDGVKAVTVTTQGAGNPDRYDDVLEWMKGRLEYYWNMEVVASLKAASTGSNPVQDRAELLEKAMEIGRNL